MKVKLITGGAGFVGSHVAVYYANKGDEIILFDNLSRAELLDYETLNAMYNKRYDNIERGIKFIMMSIISEAELKTRCLY